MNERKTGIRPRFGRLSELSISGQFFVAATIVLCLAMAVLGTWLNEQIKHSVLVTSGAQGASFMTGFLEPLIQEIEVDGKLSIERQRQLDDLFIGTPLGDTLVSIKIWREDGLVLYSTTKSLIGQQFVSSDVSKAANGEIVAEYEDLISAESAAEQALDMALIEVYAPLFRTGTDHVLAVGEIYENADALSAELRTSRIIAWLVVAATTLFMLAVLYLIVRRGASTIAAQRSELRQRYTEARRLATQNEELRLIADHARLSASESNEQFLGRIGSDIHDGPIQLLTLAMLKLTMIVRKLGSVGRSSFSISTEIEKAIEITEGALGELRDISSGLSLPEIAGLSLEEAVHLAVSRHQDLTGEKIDYTSSPIHAPVGDATKMCVYRVVQEGLNNATKYAPGAYKAVSVAAANSCINVVISDNGPGVSQQEAARDARSRLGQAGMRNRVGALKGSIAFQSGGAEGTRILVSLPIEELPGSA